MENFEKLYNEFILDKNIIEAGNAARKERKKRNIIALIICIIIDIIIYFIYKKIKADYFAIISCLIPIFMIDLIIILIISLVFGKKQKEFIPIFKEQVIKKMIKNFFTNVEYFPNKPMSQIIYNEAKYNEGYDNYYSDDYIEAKIDDKYFIDMSEVYTEKEETYTDSDGDTHTRTYTIFHGIFAKIIMDKSINSTLRIASRHSRYKDRLEMDSSEFEKKFNVYASNKIIGMQLLTADIMEEILNFRNETKNEFDIYMEGNNVYLRFHCGRMFEPKLLKKTILDEKSLNLYYNILKFTYELSNKIIKIVEETEI